MTHPKFIIRIEETPEHHVGDMGITITCKPSEMWIIKMLLSNLDGIGNYDFDMPENCKYKEAE